jgi:hypothetical protein
MKNTKVCHLMGQGSINNIQGESKEWNSMWSSWRYDPHHRLLQKRHGKWSSLNVSAKHSTKFFGTDGKSGLTTSDSQKIKFWGCSMENLTII